MPLLCPPVVVVALATLADKGPPNGTVQHLGRSRQSLATFPLDAAGMAIAPAGGGAGAGGAWPSLPKIAAIGTDAKLVAACVATGDAATIAEAWPAGGGPAAWAPAREALGAAAPGPEPGVGFVAAWMAWTIALCCAGASEELDKSCTSSLASASPRFRVIAALFWICRATLCPRSRSVSGKE